MPSGDGRRRSVAIGVALLFACVLLFGLSAVFGGTQRHSYVGGALPPNEVTVKLGHTYDISVNGGVRALGKSGANPTGLQCEWSSQGSGSQLLEISPENSQTKATNTLASFVAPISGPIHVDCIGWGTVFVDDAVNASADYSGFFLVLGMVAFGLGLILLVSPKMTSGREASARTPGEDQEIERLVHFVHVRSEDGEVADADRRDVTP